MWMYVTVQSLFDVVLSVASTRARRGSAGPGGGKRRREEEEQEEKEEGDEKG